MTITSNEALLSLLNQAQPLVELAMHLESLRLALQAESSQEAPAQTEREWIESQRKEFEKVIKLKPGVRWGSNCYLGTEGVMYSYKASMDADKQFEGWLAARRRSASKQALLARSIVGSDDDAAIKASLENIQFWGDQNLNSNASLAVQPSQPVSVPQTAVEDTIRSLRILLGGHQGHALHGMIANLHQALTSQAPA